MKQNSYLIHYGIKGMKWGVRKDKRSVNRVTRKQLKQERRENKKAQKSASKKVRKTTYVRSADSQEVKDLRQKPIAALSNAELKKINNRLNLERDYRNLRSDELNRGKKTVDRVLDNVNIANRVVSTGYQTAQNVNRVRKTVKKFKV